MLVFGNVTTEITETMTDVTQHDSLNQVGPVLVVSIYFIICIGSNISASV